jgi:hypothetical protein
LEAAATSLQGAIAAFEVEATKEVSGGVDEGVLLAALKEAFNTAGISVQRYWNATSVGPDCRTLLARYPAILAFVRVAIAAKCGETEAADFLERHSRVLAPLALVSSGTRRVTGKLPNGLLDDGEKAELKGACAAFGLAWKASYQRELTPKGHVVVAHVPWFVDTYGICGVFGEDGCEALHVTDALCRMIVRQMRNPEARHKAHTLHHTARSITPVLGRVVVPRVSAKRKRDAAEAGAAAAGGT